MKKHFSKGFTLIELLIVIAIIGILAVALLPSVLGAPSRARDASRKADINNIIAVLEAFNSDRQHYPSDEDTCVDKIKDTGAAGILNSYFKAGTSPKDPQGKGVPGSTCLDNYVYTKGTGQINYVIGAFMEQVGDMNTKIAWPKTSAGTTAVVLTPGATDNTYYAQIN